MKKERKYKKSNASYQFFILLKFFIVILKVTSTLKGLKENKKMFFIITHKKIKIKIKEKKRKSNLGI